jgi:hypothetical protein
VEMIFVMLRVQQPTHVAQKYPEPLVQCRHFFSAT